jgi:hypothetical protein
LPRVLFEIQGRKVFRWIPVSRVVLEFGLKVGPLLFGKLTRQLSSLSGNTTGGGARPWLGRHSAACAPTPKDLFYGSRCLTPSKKEQQKEQEQDAAPYRATLYAATDRFHLRSREFRDVGSFHNVLCSEIGTWRRYVFHDYKFAVQGMRGASGIR